MKRISLALVLTASLFLAGCGEENAVRAINAFGFTDVKLTGTPIFGCGEHDSIIFNHTFEALNIKGERVRGVACGNALKSFTIRID